MGNVVQNDPFDHVVSSTLFHRGRNRQCCVHEASSVDSNPEPDNSQSSRVKGISASLRYADSGFKGYVKCDQHATYQFWPLSGQVTCTVGDKTMTV